MNVRQPITAAAGIVLLVAVQQFVTLGGDRLLAEALTNAAHVPLFALLTLLLYRLLGRPRWQRLLMAAVALALVTEGLQVVTHRQPSVVDLALDVLGILPVLAALTLGRRLRRAGRPRGRLGVWAGAWGLIVVMTLAAPVRVLVAYAERDAAFPRLLVPGSGPFELLVTSNGPMQVTRGPDDWTGYANRPVLELTWSDARYPGVTFSEVVPDWSGFDVLQVDVYLIGAEPMPLTAAVGHRGFPGTARHRRLEVAPGPSRLRYPLDALLEPRGDGPARVSRLILHGSRGHEGRRLLIGDVRLVRDGEHDGPFTGTLAPSG